MGQRKTKVPADLHGDSRARSGRVADRLRAGVLPLLLATTLTASGCGFFVKVRKVAHLPTPPLQTASMANLISSFNRNAAAIHTVNAKLDLVATVGGPRAGQVKTYPDVSAFLLVQKPDEIRLVGTWGIAGTIFDMASNGVQFELNLPSNNEFIVGQNDYVPASVSNPLEKLRPAVILNSMLIDPIPSDDLIVSMNGNPETSTDYELLVVSPAAAQGGFAQLLRRIFISRINLLPHRQQLYDAAGFVATDVSYDDYRLVSGIPFPFQMTVLRPNEEYSLKMTMSQVTLNGPISGDTFHLNQPPDSRLVQLGPPVAH